MSVAILFHLKKAEKIEEPKLSNIFDETKYPITVTLQAFIFFFW